VEVAAFVLNVLPGPPARVLEVGCGAGELARTLAERGYDVLAIDPEAPDGPIFRRTRLEELEDSGVFDAVVAAYSLHHMHDLDEALGRIAALLRPDGTLVLVEFGWDLFDAAAARWYAEQRGDGRPVEAVLADWREEHAGLHGFDLMRHALETRFAERSLERVPFLYGQLEREELEPAERAAIERGELPALGFTYVGVPRRA